MAAQQPLGSKNRLTAPPSRVKWRAMKTVTAHDHRYRELPRSSPRSISLQRVGRRVYRTIPRSL